MCVAQTMNLALSTIIEATNFLPYASQTDATGEFKFRFLPQTTEKVVSTELLMENGDYSKHSALVLVKGELVRTLDKGNGKMKRKRMVREPFADYENTLYLHDSGKDAWAYNILDGTAEQDKVLFRDDLCVVVPTYMWDGVSMDKLQVLCMPMDKSLRSIRDLRACHLPLLAHMKAVTLATLKDKYGVDEDQLKLFFHYEPSTFHLHLHAAHIANHTVPSSVEYSHELNIVMFNLSLCDNYYAIILLNKREYD